MKHYTHTGPKTLFDKPDILATMLNFRLNGASRKTLAILYRCDETTIRYQCDLYHVKPLVEVYNVYSIIKPVLATEVTNWKLIDGEKLNKGKTYKEYLAKQYPLRKKTLFW